jgi:hypothetical protein
VLADAKTTTFEDTLDLFNMVTGRELMPEDTSSALPRLRSSLQYVLAQSPVKRTLKDGWRRSLLFDAK